MFDLSAVKGIIFDYGGTIDSNGAHWAEVLWDAYKDVNVPVTKEAFREAYVYGERYLATHPDVQPNHNFYDLLKIKTDLQIRYLLEQKLLEDNDKTAGYSLAISKQCYLFAKEIISKEKEILKALQDRYPMVLVSNFYGNVQAVLGDFGLLEFFDDIIESAVVGVRKPDPAIFGLGVDKLKLPASSIVVIGDSHAKDIVPASKNGCQTIWLKGPGWGDDDPDATADLIITDFMELATAFKI
ncbi:HAD family hydrolase [Dysgonomonas sp. GY617]|uniref:HAD family hydrolase n=1 Tax=Dysgonomonas sp. GY617 TaxID=2780420 RepID=UPI001883983F|nr:HAD family hydrolase [Dysgonomonas sp. GY617]MBF0578045.1 HAD family hydrolase [Dysgonomonas sp. GY617]